MPDHSGLATPKILCTPLLFYQRGGSPIGQGGEAGMKPREGKHASNHRGFSGGGGYRPPRGALDPSGRPLGPLFSPFRCATSAAPPLVRGPLFASPGRLRTSCSSWRSVPSATSQAPGLFTSGRFSRSLRHQTAKPLGSSVQLGPRAVQAPGLRSQRAERCFSFRSKTPRSATRG